MTSTINLSQTRSALERAAASTDRSGRNNAAGPIADRIRKEVHIAMLNWATVETLNNRIEMLEHKLSDLDAWQPAKFMARALTRDVIAMLIRVTDDPGPKGDRQTLLSFRAKWLAERPSELDDATLKAEDCFLAHVPPIWTDGSRTATVDELRSLREPLRDVRNNLIGHSLDYENLDLRASVPKIFPMLQLVAELSACAALLVGLDDDDLKVRWNSYHDEATRFWDVVLDGTSPAARR